MNLFEHQADAETAPAVYSVSEINRSAREIVEGGFSGIRVEGEISGLKKSAPGHWYFVLKDRKAQLDCVMFRSASGRVRFNPVDGDLVTAEGDLTIYEARGRFQLNVSAMESAGAGELRRSFELLKSRLQAEGLFAAEAKKTVGGRFRHIGVITSPSGAVLRDILSVFRRRFPATRITLIPTAVQGEQAPAEICRAIETANALRGKLGLEALIVGRGGGSPEDIQAFNEESVARAIFASELPVTSAIGHETDFSIADFVADLRAPTPSAAAELMSPSQQEYFDILRSQLGKLQHRMYQNQRRGSERLHLISKRLRSPVRRLEDHIQTLDDFSQRMLRARAAVITGKRQRLGLLQQRLKHCSPAMRIGSLRAVLNETPRRLHRSIRSRLERQGALLAELRRTLHSTSPLHTLARGYSISMDESAKVIRSVDDVSQGTRIITRLADGTLRSTVTGRNLQRDSATALRSARNDEEEI